jgi:hypothetical protein
MSDGIDKMYAPPRAEPTASADDRSDALGWCLLAAPPIAGVLVNVVPYDLGVFAGIGMIVATAVLASIDAKKWGVHQPGIAGFVFLWLVFYPRYFLRRADAGAPPRFLLALLSTAIYFVLAVGGFLFVARH